ncbi:MAG: hypothetical protein RL522_2715 [Pseudomonadota bacterium]|jgi:hypothetical protein
MSHPPSPNEQACVDGLRYALLRRVAPALRHEAVAPLQPIAMAASVLERRLRDPAPDLALVQDTAGRLVGYSRTAVQSCLELVEWLTPPPGQGLSLQAAVRSTLDLLRGSLSLRGFTLREELQGTEALVRHTGLHHVLTACLLWLTDSAGAPAEVTLRAQDDGSQIQLVLDLQATEGGAGLDDPPAYRPLRGEEVAALAHEEGIALHRQGDTLALTLARAAAP